MEARGVGFSELQSYFSLPFHEFSIVGDVCTVKDKHNRPQYDTVSLKYFKNFTFFRETKHSSEIRGLRSTKCSSETLQNLLYFMYKKTHVVFFIFHFVQFYIFTL